LFRCNKAVKARKAEKKDRSLQKADHGLRIELWDILWDIFQAETPVEQKHPIYSDFCTKMQ